MSRVAIIHRFVAAGAVCAAAACSQRVSPSLPAASLPFSTAPAERFRLTNHKVFVSDAGAGAVFVYPAGVNDPSPSAEITDGIDDPLGIAVDRNGTLYVANHAGGTSGNGTVSVYPSGATHPSLTIDDVTAPNSVAVDAHGNLYVGENTSKTVEIAEFAPGAVTPSKTVSPTQLIGFPFMGGMTVDKVGNLYAAFFIYFKPPVHVVKFASGLSNERDLGLQGLDLLDFNPGLARDGAGNLYVGTFAGVNVYSPHSPKLRRTVDVEIPQYIGAENDGTLYVPNQNGSVEIYAPGASTLQASITKSLVDPEGVAVR